MGRNEVEVRFIESDDSDDDFLEEDAVSPHTSKPKASLLATKTEKNEIQMLKAELKAKLEEVRVQMADLKKNKKAIPTTPFNVWCTRCKKEGHFLTTARLTGD